MLVAMSAFTILRVLPADRPSGLLLLGGVGLRLLSLTFGIVGSVATRWLAMTQGMTSLDLFPLVFTAVSIVTHVGDITMVVMLFGASFRLARLYAPHSPAGRDPDDAPPM